MKKVKGKRYLERFFAWVLSLSMVLSACGVWFPASADGTEEHSSGSVLTLQADAPTLDTFKEVLNFEVNSRNAGKLWTDKTVFAAAGTASDDGHFDGNRLTLTAGLDGLTGEISVGENDFLHIFSALGSSQQVNANVPIDLVLVIDISTSMTAGAASQLNNQTWKNNGQDENSRIAKTVAAIKKAHKELMEANPQNRMAIIAFGSNYTTLLPLKRYTSIAIQDKLGEHHGRGRDGGHHR